MRERSADRPVAAVGHDAGHLFHDRIVRCAIDDMDVVDGPQRCGIDGGTGRHDGFHVEPAEGVDDALKRSALVLERRAERHEDARASGNSAGRGEGRRSGRSRAGVTPDDRRMC